MVARSLRYCGVVAVLACLVAIYGVYIAGGVKIDVFPEFAPPRIVIQTEAPGLSAEEVEAVVTRPVEYGLNGTPELEAIYSESQDLSVVTTVFREDADIYRVRQLIRSQVALPPGIFVAYGGAAVARTGARQELLLHSTGSAVVIVLLLSMVFASSRTCCWCW